MTHEDIEADLQGLAFKFFYKYSRFEFALKENGYLRDLNPDSPAIPGWREFAIEWCAAYRLSPEAAELIGAAPKCQVVGANGYLEWKDVNSRGFPGDLGKVIRLLQTVRNNLFHGGKHGADGWDDSARTAMLLRLGADVLDQVAQGSRLEGDYFGCY